MNHPMVDENLLLTWGATFRKLSKDELLFAEGGQGQFYHQIVNGRVKWVNIDDEGKEFIQAVVHPGESVGELPLFDDGPYVSSAISLTDTTVLRLRKEEFLKMLHEHPEIHFSFTRMITHRLRLKFIFMKELSYPDPARKVLTVLHYYRDVSDQEFDGRKRIQLTRQQIANMTGLRVETVIRTIRSLCDDGKLHIDGGKVYL
jgi:CRP/FNR family cyclic AMP-dependent transcriptional regulator